MQKKLICVTAKNWQTSLEKTLLQYGVLGTTAMMRFVTTAALTRILSVTTLLLTQKEESGYQDLSP